jgi:pimeloyl-ACP methyl ester carboxylesterase
VASRPVRDGTCKLRDSRTLAYAEWGVADGHPVLAFHGAPGSRLWCPDDFDPGKTSTEAGVRLITVDRPGYGRSDPRPAHRLVDWPNDVEQLLDALEIDRCPVVGVSAGGPYALACGARLPHRVSRAGSVSGVAPAFHVPNVWELMSEEWRTVLERGARDPFAALDAARERSRWLADDPDSVGDPAAWPEVDRWLAEDPTMREPLLAFVHEAGRQGIDGYAWDRLAFTLPWGFELREIAVDTWLWQGEEDSMTDRSEFDLLCSEIPRAHCILYPGEGHLLRGHWGEIFEVLTAPAAAPSEELSR